MATRSRSTFEKRQKEMKRMEKQRMKAERRAERSLAKREGAESPGGMQDDNIDYGHNNDIDIVPSE